MTEAMDTDVDSSGSVDALSGSSDTDNDEVVAPKKRGRPPKSPKSTSLRKRSSLLSPNTTVPKVKRQAKAITATGSIGRGKAKAEEAEEHGFFLEDDLLRSPPTKVKPKTVIPKAKTTRTKVPLAGKASRPDRVSAAPPKPRGRPPKPLARPPGSESGEEIIFTPQIMVDISDSDSSAIRA
ncbi:hypothetical protein DL93DRAFT_2069948 [Clavulina sp. PMI_390]|nr:hypothetical protein DL93DRAFT_2069948 [Clavulina sp. PMI_390]